MGSKLKALSGGLLAAAGAAGFGALASAALNSVDALGKTSAKLGIATDALQKLHFAGEQSGIGISTMNMALQRMVRRISEAASGTGAAKDAIVELGLNAQRLNSMSPDQAFYRIADALQAVTNQADRIRLTNKLFDSEGVKLITLLQQGAEGTQKLGKQLSDLGGVISSSAIAKIEELNDKFNTFKKVLTANVAQGIGEFGDTIIGITGSITQSLSALSAFSKYVNAMTGGLAGFAIKAGVVVGVWGGLIYGAKRAIVAAGGYVTSVLASTAALVKNNIALKANTVLTHENAAAQVTNGSSRALALGMGKSGYVNYATAAPAAWSQLPSRFSKIRSAGAAAFTSISANIGLVTVGLGSALAAAREFYLYLSGQDSRTIGYGLGEKLSNWWNSEELEENNKAWAKHLDLARQAKKAEEERANAIAKTVDKLETQKKALQEARKTVENLHQDSANKIRDLLPNAEELKAVEAIIIAWEKAGVSRHAPNAERDKAIGGVAASIEESRAAQKAATLQEKVQQLQLKSKNMGKSSFQQLIEELQKRYDSAAVGKKSFFGQLILDAQNAQFEIEKYNKQMEAVAKRENAISEIGNIYGRLESIRNMGGGKQSIGAYDAGSLASYQATRAADLGLINMQNLQKEQNSITREIKKIMSDQNITLQDIAEKLGEKITLM